MPMNEENNSKNSSMTIDYRAAVKKLTNEVTDKYNDFKSGGYGDQDFAAHYIFALQRKEELNVLKKLAKENGQWETFKQILREYNPDKEINQYWKSARFALRKQSRTGVARKIAKMVRDNAHHKATL